MSEMSLAAPAGQAGLPQRYGLVAQLFHWLTVALLAVQFSTELVLPYLLPKAAEGVLEAWHVSIGPGILLATLLRLAWRLVHAPPPAPAGLPPGLRLLSRVTHWLLYALLIVLPLLGWVAASAYGAPVSLLGLIRLPALVGRNVALGEMVGAIHGNVALVLLALIALHVAGALYHGFVKRDGVLQRMLPGAWRRAVLATR